MVEGWKYDVIEGQQMSEQGAESDEQHAVQRNRRPQKRRQTKGRPVKRSQSSLDKQQEQTAGEGRGAKEEGESDRRADGG